ncbi:MreB/Mbl protein, partial [Musa troglodytarum]
RSKALQYSSASLVNHLIERTRIPCSNCRKDAGILAKEVDEVPLVGGMTRVPKVQEIVSQISELPYKVGILRGDVQELLLLDW